MLNGGGGFHVRALDPASADDLRARVAGDSNRHHSRSRSRSSGAVAGASGGGGGCSRPWAGPEWRRGRNPQENRKIQVVQAPPADDGSSSNDRYSSSPVAGRGAAVGEAAGSGPGYKSDERGSSGGGGGDEDPAELSGPAAKARGGSIRRVRLSAGTKADNREGGGGGGGWGYKAHGLGKILAFVARRQNGGGDDGGGSG